MKRRWIPLIVTYALLVLPSAALACSVCFDPRDKSRAAYVLSTILLTSSPLAIVGGAGVWLRKRYTRIQHERGEEEGTPTDD